MAMSTRIWTELSRLVGSNPADLEADAAFSWVSGELATADRELAAYARKYGVASPSDLEQLIREGKIEGHPGLGAITLSGPNWVKISVPNFRPLPVRGGHGRLFAGAA